MEGLSTAIRMLLGVAIQTTRPLHGGNLSTVELVTLIDGRQIVAKHGPLVAREARMLKAIAKAEAPAPMVLGVAGQVLLMDALPQAPASTKGWTALARGLGKLHATHGDRYGWAEDYAFGHVTISNQPCATWPEFWANHRLLPAGEKLPPALMSRIEVLAKQLPERLPSHPPLALLHGDLWTGNALFTSNGAYFIDPACYFGHNEVDLAMLHLFGTPPAAFTDCYGPLEADWQTRRAIYQLWPALVHWRLFGAGYTPMVTGLLDQLGV